MLDFQVTSDRREGLSSLFIWSTRSTKRRISRFIKSSEQAAVDDELAAWEEAIHQSSFALLPAVLTPSRAPSNTLIVSTRALFFEGPVHLDFVSGWDKGPVIEWYETHRRKGSTIIEKLQLRRDRLPPYYHEYIVVFTQGGHAYRVDRRPDPNAPFDTIMRAGCKPHDTVQTVDSRSLRESEKASDCIVEVHWQDKPTIDLLFVLSICFALRQDEQTKQYTLQRYNCYFLSWTIIMIAVRDAATWETRLDAIILEAFPYIAQEANHRMVPAAAQALSQELLQHGEFHQHVELAQPRERARAMVRTLVQMCGQVQHPELVIALELALNRAHELATLDLVLVRTLGLALERALVLELELERDLELVKKSLKLTPDLDSDMNVAIGLAQELVLELVKQGLQRHEQGVQREQEHGMETVQEATYAVRRATNAIKDAVGKDLGGLEFAALGEHDSIGGAFILGSSLQVMLDRLRELMRQCADAMSKLLFPRSLDMWSTMLQHMESWPISKPYVQ